MITYTSYRGEPIAVVCDYDITVRAQEAAASRLIFIGMLKARTPASASFYNNVIAEIWRMNGSTFAFLVSIDDREFRYLRSK